MIDQYVFACNSRLIFLQGLVVEINSLISVIKVSRNTKSLSAFPIWMYCWKSSFFCFNLRFYDFIHSHMIFIMISYIIIRYIIMENAQNSLVQCSYLRVNILTIKEPLSINWIKGFSNIFWISLFMVPY